MDGKVLDSSVRMSLYAYAVPTQPESCVCATANRLTMSPPRRMIGACSTRGTYRDVWQIPSCAGAARTQRWKIAPSPMTGGSPPGKAPAGPPTATPDADPLFATLGNVRPVASAGGSDGLALAVPADFQERGCMTGEFEWTWMRNRGGIPRAASPTWLATGVAVEDPSVLPGEARAVGGL